MALESAFLPGGIAPQTSKKIEVGRTIKWVSREAIGSVKAIVSATPEYVTERSF